MAIAASPLERFLPPYRYDAARRSTGWVRAWLSSRDEGDALEGAEGRRGCSRSTPRAGVETRASVVPIEEVFHPGDFETQNRPLPRDRVPRGRRRRARGPSRRSASARREIDLVVSVSCTGFMIPAVDAYVADALGLGPRLARLPITESGCAGGVVGLARAADYLAAHPDRAALVLALEFSSLTFQRWDRSADQRRLDAPSSATAAPRRCSSARDHPRAPARALAGAGRREPSSSPAPRTSWASSCGTRGCRSCSTSGLAPFVRREVAPDGRGLPRARAASRRDDIARWILHPGGRRMIEVMAERLGLGPADLARHRGGAVASTAT